MGKTPVVYNPKKESMSKFQKKYKVLEIVDYYSELVKELFLIRNPRYRFVPNYEDSFEQFYKQHLQGKKSEQVGKWFYFSWSKKLVHYLPEKLHQELRTARNKNIITPEEQEKYYRMNVGVAGLSVGSHAALTIVMSGGAKTIKLADPDAVSGSNLNRIRYDFSVLGKNKCTLAAQQIYQINPYSKVYQFSEGLTEKNIKEFLAGPPKLDVLVEEVDNLEMKIRLRIEAKKLGIPVLMATDNADNVIVDIERYDLNRKLNIFNGRAGKLDLAGLKRISPVDIPKLATKIAGPDYVTSRMQDSLMEVGKTLYSWPQLGTAATLSGVAIAYLVKRLAQGEKLKSGKYEINFDGIFDPEYDSKKSKLKREKHRRNFLKKLGLK